MPRVFDDLFEDTFSDSRSHTFVGIALDRSGSMSYMLDPTIAGFNEYVETLKHEANSGKPSKVSLVTFGGDVAFEFRNIEAGRLRALTRGNYKPYGNTPLYDGVNLLLDHLVEYDIPNVNAKFLVVVISDGQENASVYGSQERVRSRINYLKDRPNWKFVYIGANQDVFTVSQYLQIPTVRWDFTDRGTRSVMRGLGTYTAAYFTDSASANVQKSFVGSETFDVSSGGAISNTNTPVDTGTGTTAKDDSK